MSAVLEKIENRTIETSSGLPIHRITVETYEKMIEHGVFDEDDRVELLDGVIVEMSPKKTKHTIVTYLVNDFFQEHLRRQALFGRKNRFGWTARPNPNRMSFWQNCLCLIILKFARCHRTFCSSSKFPTRRCSKTAKRREITRAPESFSIFCLT